MTRPRRASVCRPVAESLEGRAYCAASLVLARPVAYPAGRGPADLAVADFNGDGHPDLVAADYVDNTVSVLLNRGDGTFDLPVAYAVGTHPQSVAVGDFNGDGRPDVVAVGNGTAAAAVLLNAGDGTLGPAASYPVGNLPEGVVVADVNGDGQADVVTADAGDSTVTVLAGVGDGTFMAGAKFAAGPAPIALAAADLNGDGHVDLVTLTPDADLAHVLLNKGDGTFPLFPVPYTIDPTGRAIAIADTNNDGRPDVVVSNLREATVGVLPNVGDGTLNGVVTRRTGAFPFALAVADLTGDARPEIVTADNRDNAVGVLVHNARGGFNERRTFPVGQAPEAVVVADVDGDGKPDVVSANFNDGTVAVLRNQTVFAPQTATTTTLAAVPTTVQQGDPVTLTATVSPNPVTGGGRVVQFLAGPKVVGVGRLSADGTATVRTTALPVGTVPITARFSGNGVYANSAAAGDETVLAPADTAAAVAATGVAVTSVAGRPAPPRPVPAAALSLAPTAIPAPPPDGSTPPVTAGPFVAATAVVVTGPQVNAHPGPFVPGDGGYAVVTFTNQGVARATGAITVSLSIAPAVNGMPDLTAAVPVTVVGNATFPVDLAVRAGFAVPVRFTLPTALTDGPYTVLASVTGGPAFAAGQVSAAAVAAGTSITVSRVLVPFVPGDAGSAVVTITDQGSGRAAGAVTVSLSIAPADGSAAAVPLPVVGNATFGLNLRGATSASVPVRFQVPVSLTGGSYTIFAALAPVRTLTADQVSPAVAASAVPTLVAVAFGDVGIHHGYVLARTLSNGAVVDVSIAGPGTGTLVDDGGGAVSLDVVNTGPKSTVRVVPRSGTVTLGGLTDPAPLGGVNAAGVVLTGPLQLGTGVHRVTLAGATNASLTIGPRYRSVLSLGVLVNTTVVTSGVFQSLSVTRWAGGGFNGVGFAGTVTSAGDLNATIALTGVGLRQSLRGLSVGGAFAGVLAGPSIGTVRIGGDLAGGVILAGATLGPAGVLGDDPAADGTGDDVFNVGRLTSVQVGGNVTAGSVVAAGISPVSDVPFTAVGATPIADGRIGRITVGGSVDPTALFLAASVPAIG